MSENGRYSSRRRAGVHSSANAGQGTVTLTGQKEGYDAGGFGDAMDLETQNRQNR